MNLINLTHLHTVYIQSIFMITTYLQFNFSYTSFIIICLELLFIYFVYLELQNAKICSFICYNFYI